jgi:GABA permease
VTAPAPHQLLVITNESVEGTALVEIVREIVVSRAADVLVVAPALNTRLRHWMSDSDSAHRSAAARLADLLPLLRRAGVAARGEICDADPMHAIEDAMRGFAADEIVVATHPEEHSNFLAHELVARACARFGVPVVHVVIDRERHREFIAA